MSRMGEVNFCEGCRFNRSFPDDTRPFFFEAYLPELARKLLEHRFGIKKTPVRVLDQNDVHRATMNVPSAALEMQGSIKGAIEGCDAQVGRKCGALAMLDEKYA